MKIQNISFTTKDNKSVLAAWLVLASGKKHTVYFEVDTEFKDFISKDASSFIPVALALSMNKKENLEIEGTTSKGLLANTSKIMKILQSWDTGFSPVLIGANESKKDLIESQNVGCFFSGGVDSFYTYLQNKNKINYFIFVHGFDISAKDIGLYEKIEKNIIEIANKEKVKLIKVKTNLRETLDQYFGWDMAHEFALASISLFLDSGFKEIFMSCGQTDTNAEHHYMTPELDVLWSTEHMKVNHFGCSADKISKLRYLANNKLVMNNLRVCWQNKHGEYNCCVCEKCFRNMLALHASDSLEKCKSFTKSLDLNKLKKTRVDQHGLKYFTAALNTMKLKNDTSEVRIALEECINNNKNPNFQQRFVNNFRDGIGLMDKKYNKNRLFWYLSAKGLI